MQGRATRPMKPQSTIVIFKISNTLHEIIVWSKGEKRLLTSELSFSINIIGSKAHSLAISIEVLLHVSTERLGSDLTCAAPI